MTVHPMHAQRWSVVAPEEPPESARRETQVRPSVPFGARQLQAACKLDIGSRMASGAAPSGNTPFFMSCNSATTPMRPKLRKSGYGAWLGAPHLLSRSSL